MDNDVYPNSTEYFTLTEPEDQKKAKQEEKGKVQEAKRIIDEALKRMDERIAFYDTLDSIPDEVMSDPKELGFTLKANKLTKMNLQAERGWLDELKRSH